MQYNGKWNDILFAGLEAFWLYNNGNEFTARTGGWEKTINSPGGTLEKLSDHIKLVTNVAHYAGVATIMTDYIDLSDFSKLYVKLQCESSSPWTSAQIGLLKEGSTMVYPWKVSGNYNDIATVDISACMGMYRVSVWAECNNNIPSTVDVYSVLLS